MVVNWIGYIVGNHLVKFISDGRTATLAKLAKCLSQLKILSRIQRTKTKSLNQWKKTN